MIFATTNLNYNLDITFSCWIVFVADFPLIGEVRRNGTRLFISWKRTLLLCYPPQNVLLGEGGDGQFSISEPSRMDEALVTPKSLLNYKEIPVVRAWDRREVIGCCSAAVSCIWRGFSPLSKTWIRCSQSVVCSFHCLTLAFSVVFHSSNSLFSFINNCCPSCIFFF